MTKAHLIPDSFSCSHRMALRRRSGARRVAFAKNWLRWLPLASKDAGNILGEFALSEQPSPATTQYHHDEWIIHEYIVKFHLILLTYQIFDDHARR